jgi:hypothetical protein
MITLDTFKLVAAATALSVVATGCNVALVRCVDTSEYVLAEHQAAALVSSNTAPEVSTGAIYKTPTFLPSVKTIGLQFPDARCVTETSAKATGDIRNQNDSDAIMATNCGVWLAELERALTAHGYKVVSWSAIKQEQATKNITTYQAAASLGAQVVFVVNSMETNDLTPSSTSGSRTTYFKSDEAGSKKDPLAMPQSEREPLRRFVVSHNGANANQIIGWAGTLDLTAVSVEGQAVWFFRHHIQRARFAQTGMRFLFRRGSKTSPFEIWRPQGIDEPAVVDDRSASDVEFTQVKSGPADPFQAEKLAMVRAVAGECVQRFASGQ